MKEILEQFPPSTQNNARAIVRKELERMQDVPSERQAQKLEYMFGIVSDFKDGDGEPPVDYELIK